MPQFILCNDVADIVSFSSENNVSRTLFTVDSNSSKIVMDSLSTAQKSGLNNNPNLKKRKATNDLLFEEYQGSLMLCLAKEDLSLQMSAIPVTKKSILHCLSGKLRDQDQVYIFADPASSSETIRVAFFLIGILCRFDSLMAISDPMFYIKIQKETTQFLSVAYQSKDSIEDIATKRGKELASTIVSALNRLISLLQLNYLFDSTQTFFIQQLLFAVIKDKDYEKGLKRFHRDLDEQLIQETAKSANTCTEKTSSCNDDPVNTKTQKKRVPSKRKEGEGLRVFEFFSGIGGMRLGLPDTVDGIPITQITAFDCSTTANKVYDHNFHLRPDPLHYPARIQSSILRTCLVQHLSVTSADNAAEIWTMSPPCQPFTRTRGAHQLDNEDNRSQGLYHLMTLLLQMHYMPRYIMVENVAGFLGSRMHTLWCQVLRRCQYQYHEFLLSPDKTVGLPNSRTRYYCIARFREDYDSVFPINSKNSTNNDIKNSNSNSYKRNDHSSSVGTENCAAVDDHDELLFMQQSYNDTLQQGQSEINETITGKEKDDSEDEQEEESREEENEDENLSLSVLSKQDQVYRQLPIPLQQQLQLPSQTLTIGEVLGGRYFAINQSNDIAQLYVNKEVLSSSWAGKMLSIATIQDRLTYCFTKGYGKRVDHSAGSCLYIGNENNTEVVAAEKSLLIDRNNLHLYFGRIRLFHPEELLLLFGFPQEFSFNLIDKQLSLQHRWGCIGNSVNVAVIRLVMSCLFEDTLWNSL